MLFIGTASFGLLTLFSQLHFLFIIQKLTLEFLNSNSPGVHRVVLHSENLSVKYQEQKFYIKFAFSEHHLTGLSIEKFKNSVFGVLIKISILVLNQLKSQQ